MSDKPKKPKYPNIELPPDLEAIYANMVRISHSPSEMIFDFARLLPGQSGPRVQARLLMSPIGAKMFLRALSDNLSRYEATFGEISVRGSTSLASDLFRSIHPSDPPPET